ncbi:hypothetical protein SDC9_69295 [bioreactor metagenome]|uniref:DUF302 domain-containing protein n=1 Tax=bioreactor metagenome TaxID=1076179 RepID=A0A644Y2V1_9ZZZZ
MKYYNEVQTDKSFEEALTAVRNSLQNAGFRVVSEINMQQKLRDSLGHSMNGYMILGACSPKHALTAITHEPNIGVLLPCNIIVAENNDGTCRVAAVNPLVAMQSVGNNQLEAMATEVNSMLENALKL